MIAILIQYDSLGLDMGPFNLVSDLGNVVPNTATRQQLLDGINVTVDNDNATQITVTSTGFCDMFDILTINYLTTTTTTSSTTTTTTTEAWTEILSFVTNSGSGDSFGPYLFEFAGEYKWDLGDGSPEVLGTEVTHTYADSTEKTVRLYGRGNPQVQEIDIDNCHVVGALNFNNDAFSAVEYMYVNTNAEMTSLVMPASYVGTMSQIYAQACNLTGNLDLTTIGQYSTSAIIYVNDNTNLTSITLAETVTGSLARFSASTCNLTGVMDLSMITGYSSGNIIMNINPLLTGVTFASSVTGQLEYINLISTGITGTLDLSMFTALTSWAGFHLYNCTNLTNITFAPVITGNVGFIYASSCNLTGELDLSMFTSFVNTYGDIHLDTNPNLTSIVFAPAVTGMMRYMYIHACNLTGNVDLSMFDFGNNGEIWISGNPLMTGVTFKNTITGPVNQLLVSGEGLTGTLNLSMFTSFASLPNSMINIGGSLLSDITFGGSVTGTLGTLIIVGVSLGYIDLTGLTQAVNGSACSIQLSGASWTPAITNHMIVDINTIATGTASRTLQFAYSCIDSTSGGYDGLAAKTALEGKGFTVTVSECTTTTTTTTIP